MGTKCKHAKTPILPPPPPGNQALWRRGVRTHSNMAYCFASVVPALRQKNITTRRPKKKEKAKGNKSGGMVGKERRKKNSKRRAAVQAEQLENQTRGRNFIKVLKWSAAAKSRRLALVTALFHTNRRVHVQKNTPVLERGEYLLVIKADINNMS